MNKRIVNIVLTLSFFLCIGIITVLIIALNISKKRLEKLGDIVDEMAIQHIITNVTINETIPLSSEITVREQISVNIKMFLETEIPFKAEIPISENLMVPFKIGLKDYIELDTLIEVTDYVNILVDDTIPLNQKVNMALLGGKGIKIPIKGNIPVHQSLKIGFNEKLPVKSVVPLDMIIIDTLPVGLSMKIPVDLKVPVRIPLKTSALISFDGPLPVDAEIPIEITVPVDIPLESTTLSSYFKQLASGLRNLTSLDLKEKDYEKH